MNSYNNFKKTLINDGNYFIKISKKFLFDIDDMEDWYLAEKFLKFLEMINIFEPYLDKKHIKGLLKNVLIAIGFQAKENLLIN